MFFCKLQNGITVFVQRVMIQIYPSRMQLHRGEAFFLYIHMIPKLAPQEMPSSWSTNPPPKVTPPQKFGFNKALLRETNGLISHHPDDSDFAHCRSYALILPGIYRGIAGWCWFNVAFILRHSRLGRLAHHWVPDSTLCQRTLLGGKRGNKN